MINKELELFIFKDFINNFTELKSKSVFLQYKKSVGVNKLFLINKHQKKYLQFRTIITIRININKSNAFRQIYSLPNKFT